MIIPDINWYRSQSKKHNVTLRCPYSASDLCPKYAKCKSLLEEAHCIDPVSTTERNRLDAKWLDYQSVIKEDNFMVRGPKEEYDKPGELKKFCPEVTYDVYGYFASHLYQFFDDIDKESRLRCKLNDAEEYFALEGWWEAIVMNYTECKYYSMSLNKSV